LYSLVGSYGIAAPVPDNTPFAFQRHIGLLRPTEHVEAAYLLYAMRSREVFDQATEAATGSAQLTVPLRGLRLIELNVPSVAEQREIVRRVEALFALADKIEARVQAATARVQKITQAILAKAFRGELVPTEAELARAENRPYEPATVLLERIHPLHSDDSRSRRRRTRHVSQFGEDSRHSK